MKNRRGMPGARKRREESRRRTQGCVRYVNVFIILRSTGSRPA